MSRGEYAALPLEVDADIEACPGIYSPTAAADQSITPSNKRLVKTVTFVVSLLALSWIVALGVMTLNNSSNRLIAESDPLDKQSFNYYSYDNSTNNQSSSGSFQAIKQSIDSAIKATNHDRQPSAHRSSGQSIEQIDSQSSIPSPQQSNNQPTNEPVVLPANPTIIPPDNQQPAIQPINQTNTQFINPPTHHRPRSPFKIPRLSYMKPGSLAPANFNFSGVCGVDQYKCVVSFGLYGKSEKYVGGAIENAKLMPKHYDGWSMRVYHDNSVPIEALNQLRELNVELIESDQTINGTIAGMFWRFLVATDPIVDRYIIRDTDSRLNERERAAVDEWLSSGYSIHTMRDHPSGHALPMSGGLWGGTKGVLANMPQLIDQFAHNTVGADQNLLNQKVYPFVKFDHLAHDAYTCSNYLNSIGFPTKRPDNYEHVGQVYENGVIDQDAIDRFTKRVEAPKKCRRNPDWIYG